MNTLNFSYQNTLYFLASFATVRSLPVGWRFNVFAFALSADHSLNTAMHMPNLHSGGITGAIRCTCANSAGLAEPPAADESHVGGFSPAVRQSFQRIILHVSPFPP
jgi:hypothetical protein